MFSFDVTVIIIINYIFNAAKLKQIYVYIYIYIYIYKDFELTSVMSADI